MINTWIGLFHSVTSTIRDFSELSPRLRERIWILVLDKLYEFFPYLSKAWPTISDVCKSEDLDLRLLLEVLLGKSQKPGRHRKIQILSRQLRNL
jgi:hypothetical protein